MKYNRLTLVLTIIFIILLGIEIFQWIRNRESVGRIGELEERIYSLMRKNEQMEEKNRKLVEKVTELKDEKERLEKITEELKKAINIKSRVYRNEKYGFEIQHFTDKAPYAHDWEEKRHPNSPRRLWDATFFDSDFGVPYAHLTGISVIHMTVNECLPEEDLDSCLPVVSSLCGTVSYKDLEKIYGKGSFKTSPTTFLDFPAKRLRICCGDDAVEEGIAILRKNRLYTILFLTSPQINTPFSRALAELMISTFKFIEEEMVKEEIQPELLPDLVIKDFYYRGPIPYLYTEYCNTGKSSVREVFLIKTESDAGMFSGNSFYPHFVPEPGECKTTGGLSIGLVGVKEGETKEITVTVDWENKVKESNEENNTMTKTIEFYPTENKCEDSDGGRNFYVKGSVMIRKGKEGTGVGDCCKESRAGGTCVAEARYLYEAVCESNKPTVFIYECPQGCRKGVCMQN